KGGRCPSEPIGLASCARPAADEEGEGSPAHGGAAAPGAPTHRSPQAGARPYAQRTKKLNLHRKLQPRAGQGAPNRLGLIGAGKFGSMYLSQIRRTPGMHLVGVADLSPPRAKASLKRVGWPAAALGARSLADAAKKGSTHVHDDAFAMIASPHVDVII